MSTYSNTKGDVCIFVKQVISVLVYTVRMNTTIEYMNVIYNSYCWTYAN